MAPPAERSATLNFRTSEDVPVMLKELAESAGVSMTDYVVTLIRAQYKLAFPEKAHAFETPAERLERQMLSPQESRRQERYRAELDAARDHEDAGSKVGSALMSMMAARGAFDSFSGSDWTIAVEMEWEALKAVRHFQQERSKQTEAVAIRSVKTLTGFYLASPRQKGAK